MANTDRARKLMVRTALVTSTTIATLVGAQNFAMIDARSFQAIDIVTPEEQSVPIAQTAPEATILNVAPSITILRQSGQQLATNPTTIQPPAASQITAPSPVVVQQPARQRSRSSR